MTAYSDIPQLYGIDSIHLLVMFSLNIVINVVLQVLYISRETTAKRSGLVKLVGNILVTLTPNPTEKSFLAMNMAVPVMINLRKHILPTILH